MTKILEIDPRQTEIVQAFIDSLDQELLKYREVMELVLAILIVRVLKIL